MSIEEVGALERRMTQVFLTVKTIYVQCRVSLQGVVSEDFTDAACLECSGTVKQFKQKTEVSVGDMVFSFKSVCELKCNQDVILRICEHSACFSLQLKIYCIFFLASVQQS